MCCRRSWRRAATTSAARPWSSSTWGERSSQRSGKLSSGSPHRGILCSQICKRCINNMYEYDESRQTSQAGLIQSMLRWSTTIHQGTDFSDSESWCVLRLSGVSGGQIFKLWHIGFMPELDASGCTTNTMLQQGSGALWRVSPGRHAGIFLWQESRELHLNPQHLQNR